MLNFTKREQIVILILIVVVAGIMGYRLFIYNDIKVSGDEYDNLYEEKENEENLEDIDRDYIHSDKENHIENNNDEKNDIKNNNNDYKKETSDDIIMVDICGEVKNPGVVVLKQGDRVEDAIIKAGGLTEKADIARINRAKKVSDEEKIVILAEGEIVDFEMNYLNNTANMQNQSMSDGKVNINLASQEELESLPGIGEVIASRIVDYRNKKKFSSIEEIKQVSGIGIKKFESIKEEISID